MFFGKRISGEFYAKGAMSLLGQFCLETRHLVGLAPKIGVGVVS